MRLFSWIVHCHANSTGGWMFTDVWIRMHAARALLVRSPSTPKCTDLSGRSARFHELSKHSRFEKRRYVCTARSRQRVDSPQPLPTNIVFRLVPLPCRRSVHHGHSDNFWAVGLTYRGRLSSYLQSMWLLLLLLREPKSIDRSAGAIGHVRWSMAVES